MDGRIRRGAVLGVEGSVAVEIKRRGEIDGVEQLTRYLELLNRDPLLAPVQGVFAAQEIKRAVAASFEDMMCLVSAQKAGDPFPIRETMIVDGIFTCIGAILGSPFGTVIYIGHPVHKANGAKTGYSFINGVVYLILCLSGVFPIIVSLFNKCTTGPIIFIFGLMICEECTKHIPERLTSKPELASQINNSYQFDLTGDDGGK